METRQRGGVEINLRDLLFYILYHWRSILVVVLIGTIGLGGYRYLTVKSIHDRGEKTPEEIQYEYDVKSYEASVATSEQAVRNYRRLIAARKEYRDGSLLYKLNPAEVWNAVRVYFIKLEVAMKDTQYNGMLGDPADWILSIYAGTMDSLMDTDAMMEAFGTENSAYVREVASVSVDNELNTVTISTIAPTQEDAERQLAYLDKRLKALSPKAYELYPHMLETVRDNTFTSTRSDLNTASTNITSEIEGYQNALNSNEANIARGGPAYPSDNVKRMALFGCLISLAAMLVFYFIRYVVSGRFHESRDLTARYGIPVYAEYVHSRAWNHHPGKLLDRLLEHLEFRKKMRKKEVVDSTLAALLGEKVPSGVLLLTGSVPTEKIEKLAGEIRDRLKDGPEIKARGNLESDSETLIEAGRADAVVVVEEMHVSRVKDVDRIAELMTIAGANPVGFVTI